MKKQNRSYKTDHKKINKKKPRSKQIGYKTDHNWNILQKQQKTTLCYTCTQLYQNLKFTETRVGKRAGIKTRLNNCTESCQTLNSCTKS